MPNNFFLRRNKNISFRILFFFLLFPCVTFGKEVPVFVFDCKTNSPISNVQIYSEKHEFLGTTNQDGKANLFLFKEKKITFSKLGYQDKSVVVNQINSVCLENKMEHISVVTIGAKRINYFDTLTGLRRENRTNFLDFDAMLTYSFDYVATNLKDSSIIDTAYGSFTVIYEQGYKYPNLFSNSNRYEKVNEFHYEYNKMLPEAYFSRIKYLHASNLLCCYDMMEQKFNQNVWWNYLGMDAEKKTKIFSIEDGSREFATYNDSGKISKRFYFDQKDVLNKIEIFRPMFFYQGNFDDKNCKFFVVVNYTKEYPRVAESVSYSYEVDSVAFPYKVQLNIKLVGPQPRKIDVVKGNEKKVVLTLIGSFHDIFLNLQYAREQGWIRDN